MCFGIITGDGDSNPGRGSWDLTEQMFLFILDTVGVDIFSASLSKIAAGVEGCGLGSYFIFYTPCCQGKHMF